MRAWILVFALPLILSAACAPGESPSGTCTPQNCPGCCDALGQCQVGTTVQSCGISGGICAACPLGQQCQAGICQVPQQVDTCAGCPGCCLNGQCMSGTSPSACGPAGGSCTVCNPGQQCVSGRCQGVNTQLCNPNNCSGCCLGGQCVTNPSKTQCGINGYACVPCTGNQVCDRGQCLTKTEECSSDNCPGCCWNNQCFPGNVRQACGTGGAVCEECTGSEGCESGRCKGQANTTCDIIECAAGCCGRDGRCHILGGDQACGILATQCQQCAYYQECKFGTSCQNKTSGGTGVPCGNTRCPVGYCCDGYNQCITAANCTYGCRCDTTNPPPTGVQCGNKRCNVGDCCDGYNNCVPRANCTYAGCNCGGTTNPTCSNCTGVNQCCKNGTCLTLYQGSPECGTRGGTCSPCAGAGCDLTTHKCQGSNTGTFDTCITQVELNCSSCGNPARIRASVRQAATLLTYYSYTSTKTVSLSGGQGTVTFDECPKTGWPASDFTNGIDVLLEDCSDNLAGCQNIGECTLTNLNVGGYGKVDSCGAHRVGIHIRHN